MSKNYFKLFFGLLLAGVSAFAQPSPPAFAPLGPPLADPWKIAAWKANLDAERSAYVAPAVVAPKVFHTVQFGGAMVNYECFVILQGSTNLIEWIDLAAFPAANNGMSYGDTNDFAWRFYRQIWVFQPVQSLTVTNK